MKTRYFHVVEEGSDQIPTAVMIGPDPYLEAAKSYLEAVLEDRIEGLVRDEGDTADLFGRLQVWGAEADYNNAKGAITFEWTVKFAVEPGTDEVGCVIDLEESS